MFGKFVFVRNTQFIKRQLKKGLFKYLGIFSRIKIFKKKLELNNLLVFSTKLFLFYPISY